MSEKEHVLSSIRLDGGTRIRDLDEPNVERLVEVLLDGGAFRDNVTAWHDGTDYWLSHGFHRMEAYKLTGVEEIPLDVRQGTVDAAREDACRPHNAGHGMPETRADRERRFKFAIKLHPKWSARQLGQLVCGAKNTLAKYRDELESIGQIDQCSTVETTDGREYPREQNPRLVDIDADRKERQEAKLAEMQRAAKANESGGSTPAGWEIRHGDCLDELQTLQPESVRLIFADPPYNIGVDYGDGQGADSLQDDDYLAWCSRWIRMCVDALTPNGSLWVMINDEWAAHYAILLEDCGLHRRSWIKWYETFGVNCAQKFNRCSRHIFYCVKNEDNFLFNIDAVTRPSDRQTKYNDKRANPDGKIWDDVWQIPRLTGTCNERIPSFPTQVPLAITNAIVGCASNPGDLVVDPFSGSGSTGIAALNRGCRYIGIEKQKHFAELSRLRLTGWKRQETTDT